MPGFCANCGFPMESSVSFCSRCGARQPGAPNAPAPPQQQQPQQQPYPQMMPPPQQQQQQQQYPPRPASKSNLGTIIICVVVGFCALAGLGIFAAVRFLHHEKEVVVAKAAAYGIDLSSHPSKTSATSGQSSKACELVPKELAAQILGEPIDHAHPAKDEAGTCLYYGPPGLNAKLAKEQADKAAKEVQAGNPPPNIPDLAKVLTGVVQAERDGDEAPMLIFLVSRGDGHQQMMALEANKAIFGQIPGGVLVDVPGVGDRAIRAANLGLNVLKGDTIMRIITSPMPDANNKEIALARAVLPKI